MSEISTGKILKVLVCLLFVIAATSLHLLAKVSFTKVGTCKKLKTIKQNP